MNKMAAALIKVAKLLQKHLIKRLSPTDVAIGGDTKGTCPLGAHSPQHSPLPRLFFRGEKTPVTPSHTPPLKCPNYN